jgi:GNAT superfamily N-acetyltransferase
MRYQQETIATVIIEAMPLFEKHYKELAKHQDKVKYDPNWDFYYKAEQAEMLYIFTARADDGTLVGYNCYFINPHPHYSGMLCALNDIFYISPEYRGKLAGMRLLKFSEDRLKELRGVNWFFMHMKPEHDFSRMLISRGYDLHEHIYSKVVD